MQDTRHRPPSKVKPYGYDMATSKYTSCQNVSVKDHSSRSPAMAGNGAADTHINTPQNSKKPCPRLTSIEKTDAATTSAGLDELSTAASTAVGTSTYSYSSVSYGPGTATSYDMGCFLGSGSFGLVTEARCRNTGEKVAIKRVLQDPRYKNRELDIMKELHHPNVVGLKDYFYTEFSFAEEPPTALKSRRTNQEIQRYLNVVMEHVPETVYRVIRSYERSNQRLPPLLVRLYTYQMCRSLGYLHSLGICHRDVKPQNFLVDTSTHVLKLCDFGSAKRLIKAEPSVAYICSRFYRAPELMLGATEYTTAIDIWSLGCVLGELLIGKPLFAGDTSVDQLVKIIKILGTPTRQQMEAMNHDYGAFRFPDVRPKDWKSAILNALSPSPTDFEDVCPAAALDLLAAFLKYEPHERLSPYESLAHPFFDPLRVPGCALPNGSPLPALFNFSEDELNNMSPRTRTIVVPNWWVAHHAADSVLRHGGLHANANDANVTHRSTAPYLKSTFLKENATSSGPSEKLDETTSDKAPVAVVSPLQQSLIVQQQTPNCHETSLYCAGTSRTYSFW